MNIHALAGLVGFVLGIGQCGAGERRYELVPGSPPPIAHGDLFYDCDTAANHSSAWSRSVDNTGEASGFAYFRQVIASGANQWSPYATIGLASEDDMGKGRSGLAMMRATNEVVFLLSAEAGRTTRLPFDVTPPSPFGEVHFAIRWSPSKVEVRVDPDPTWHSVAPVAGPLRFALSCSTAEVVFHDIVIRSPLAAPSP